MTPSKEITLETIYKLGGKDEFVTDKARQSNAGSFSSFH